MTTLLDITNREMPRYKGLLRWVVALALVLSATESTPGAMLVGDGARATSVLELQRLVDTMLVLDHEDFGAGNKTNVVDLQRALLETVRADPPREEDGPDHREEAILPTVARYFLPATTPSLRLACAPALLENPSLTPRPEGKVPRHSGAWVRYQFYLLSNAPPPEICCPVLKQQM